MHEQRADPSLQAIRQLVEATTANTASESKRISMAQASFFVSEQDGLLKHRSTSVHGSTGLEHHRVVVPQARRRALLEAYHISPIYGHRGYQTLYELLSRYYYWAGMYSDCVDFVHRCEVCAVRKPFHRQFAPPAKARPTPARPFHSLALDIKGPLLTTDNNNSYILVIVCLLTRFVVAVPLPDTTQTTIARALMDNVFCVHGFPYSMQVDNAAYFTGTTMRALTDLFGIKLIKVLPFQPTSNGSAEAIVKSVSQALQRHGNAMRSWDRMLQMVVHGLNCTETAHLGMSPYFALFGRDPVGVAELEWPELQRLDVDGDGFVKDLATQLRSIWSALKATSDEVKRQAAERANKQRAGQPLRPLKPGDFVYVEHGDEEHSKRLGKAGLPRRRRFKLLEYHPDRGYVKIDTDGLNLIDKVSLGRISRAPSWYTVRDTSTPITKLERHGHPNMPLPPGWKAVLKHGKTRDYQVYAGPGGKGTADTPVDAWRQYNNDPVYMPQPNVLPLKPTPSAAATRAPLLPSLYKVVTPVKPAPPAAPAPAGRRSCPICRQATCRRGPKCLEYWQSRASAPASAPDAASPPPTNAPRTVAPLSALVPNQRVRVRWTNPVEYYNGTIKDSRVERGNVIHHLVHYDDGQQLWHNMTRESWILLQDDGLASDAGGSILMIANSMADGRASFRDAQRQHRDSTSAERDQQVIAFLWCNDVGDDLVVAPSHD